MSKPPDRIPDKRLKGLRGNDAQSRVLTIVDLMASQYELAMTAEEDKDRNAAARTVLSCEEALRKNGQYVGKQEAELAEKVAELLKENKALKRGSGVLAGTLPEGDEGDSPVH